MEFDQEFWTGLYNEPMDSEHGKVFVAVAIALMAVATWWARSQAR